MKESQKRSLFLLSFLQEVEETVKGSSVDQITVRGLVVRCEKMHGTFSAFPKILFLILPVKQKGEFQGQKMYIFLGGDCPKSEFMDLDYLELRRSPSCLRKESESTGDFTSSLFPLYW